mgnify:FL=1
MIRRLRWKITGVTLLVSALVLTAVFACVYLFSRNNIAQSYEYQLRQAVVSGTSEVRAPCFVAEVLPSGTVRVSGSNYYDLQDEDTLLPLVTAALSADADSGVLPAQHMRYFRLEGALTVRIAFMDSTFEQATLRSLVRVCLLIGAAALLVLFGLSWLLSGFVTRPVARTWQNQQQFLSDASHELKTPLTVILSSADLLKTSAQPEQRQYVDNISVESRRMKALVEDMLTLSRTESGRAAPFVPLDLSDLVTDAALRFEPVAFEAGHPLQYDIQNGASLSGDRQQLDQLLDILLDNAVKYAAKGAPIRLTLDISGKNAVLAVENPGDPIPPDKLPHIFDRFYRVDDARTGAGGFGLGLAIAQQIVRRHKGTITAASDARATRFTVTLPLRH